MAFRRPLTGIRRKIPRNVGGMPVALSTGIIHIGHISEVHMRRGFIVRSSLGAALLLVAGLGARAIAAADAPLAIDTARVTIDGTSNVHEYTASTTKVRVTRAQIGAPAIGADFWENALKPGGVEVFEIAIPAASLSSPKEGLDKNMHKALKAQEHPDITFRLLRVEPGQAGALKGIGMLRIAGVEREVALTLKTQRKESSLTVTGKVDLLMTDYGITPPKAMLGMLKTDPKVTITFETVLTVPLT
jgi:polyisoprenoid-binding protein YceI